MSSGPAQPRQRYLTVAEVADAVGTWVLGGAAEGIAVVVIELGVACTGAVSSRTDDELKGSALGFVFASTSGTSSIRAPRTGGPNSRAGGDSKRTARRSAR